MSHRPRYGPKLALIGFRLAATDVKLLRRYCRAHRKTISEVLRGQIEALLLTLRQEDQTRQMDVIDG